MMIRRNMLKNYAVWENIHKTFVKKSQIIFDIKVFKNNIITFFCNNSSKCLRWAFSWCMINVKQSNLPCMQFLECHQIETHMLCTDTQRVQSTASPDIFDISDEIAQHTKLETLDSVDVGFGEGWVIDGLAAVVDNYVDDVVYCRGSRTLSRLNLSGTQKISKMGRLASMLQITQMIDGYCSSSDHNYYHYWDY